MRHRHIPFFFFLFLLLAGCIAVKDFGAYWEGGSLDATLEGKWNSTRTENRGKDVAFTVDGNMYRMRFEDGQSDQFVRTLVVGESTYLMVKKKPEDKGGTLIPYVKQDEFLVFFAPNRDKRKDFTARHPDIPFRITRTSFTIDALNDENMEWLKKISSEPEWWIAVQNFKRAE